MILLIFQEHQKSINFHEKLKRQKVTALSNPESAVFMRILWGDCILTRGLTESVLFAPKPRAEASSPSAPAKK